MLAFNAAVKSLRARGYLIFPDGVKFYKTYKNGYALWLYPPGTIIILDEYLPRLKRATYSLDRQGGNPRLKIPLIANCKALSGREVDRIGPGALEPVLSWQNVLNNLLLNNSHQQGLATPTPGGQLSEIAKKLDKWEAELLGRLSEFLEKLRPRSDKPLIVESPEFHDLWGYGIWEIKLTKDGFVDFQDGEGWRTVPEGTKVKPNGRVESLLSGDNEEPLPYFTDGATFTFPNGRPFIYGGPVVLMGSHKVISELPERPVGIDHGFSY